MSSTSFPPVYDEPAQQASENLRQTLPLLQKHQVAANPVNYAVWYEYVSGTNQQLTNDIDDRLSKNQIISTEDTQYLYEKYVLMGMPDRIESSNNDLQKVVNHALGNLNKVEQETSQCLSGLSDTQSALEECDNINEVKVLVGDILASSQVLKNSSDQFKQELKQSSQDIQQLKKELETVKEMARTDGLTGLLNRGAFNMELDALCQQKNSNIALLMFDLDHFKNLNDTYGHVLGDKVLQFFSSLLKKNAGTQHLAARYGGEEMAIIMIDASEQEATALANTVRLALAESRLKRKGNDESIGQVTVSVGVSMLKQDDSPTSVIDRTDKALYQSKESGRNQVTILL
ncbi:MAG: diguanylate cyclase [Methylophagaceae bacterium]